MKNSITYVAMDTHKKQHSVAIHYPCQEEITEFTVINKVDEIKKMVQKIKKKATGEIIFCYEAGVCGFSLKRRIESLGCNCKVIAPSLIPVKPGDRVKTDRRDALKLLSLLKADLLTEVYAPDANQEAAREITRCRQTAVENLGRIRHQIQKFLVRNGYIFAEGASWTKKYMKWLGSLEFDNVSLRAVFESYFVEMEHSLERLEGLNRQVLELADSEPYKEIVGLLCCFRGIDKITAISIITEIFNFGRFSTAGELMSYLGLTSSEYSSGSSQKKGSITKNGNKRVRRLLIEASWHYRHPVVIGQTIKKRRQGQPQWAINAADKAATRLRKRYWYLINKGKAPCKAVTAIARELIGFIWAILRQYQGINTAKAA